MSRSKTPIRALLDPARLCASDVNRILLPVGLNCPNVVFPSPPPVPSAATETSLVVPVARSRTYRSEWCPLVGVDVRFVDLLANRIFDPSGLKYGDVDWPSPAPVPSAFTDTSRVSPVPRSRT
jgi:hypothetical protein